MDTTNSTSIDWLGWFLYRLIWIKKLFSLYYFSSLGDHFEVASNISEPCFVTLCIFSSNFVSSNEIFGSSGGILCFIVANAMTIWYLSKTVLATDLNFILFGTFAAFFQWFSLILDWRHTHQNYNHQRRLNESRRFRIFNAYHNSHICTVFTLNFQFMELLKQEKQIH